MKKRQAKSAGPITRGTPILRMIRDYPQTCAVLESYGLPCTECALVLTATVELGAQRHHLDLGRLLRDLNKAATARS
ncbi:MAG: disulfide oxidoreductase [Deltaproteobacteria bacterium]|nr:disulfide oxidoreductase [Deltaproteobacteria bacterium]